MNTEKTKEGIRVVYRSRDAGRFMFLASLMVIVGMVGIWLALDTDVSFKMVIGIFVCSLGILFFGFALFTFMTLLFSKNKVLMTVTHEGIINRKGEVVPFQQMRVLSTDWHTRSSTGMVFKQLSILKSDQTWEAISFYNIVSEKVIVQVVEQYIIPNVADDCKVAWEHRVLSSIS
ncbi:hypothetical protein A374_08619 [Fictibacillus macauensis ZFHKF-1]|uniref:DUF304 domain-containing protein n=1 Tax=Fictibacillus macauensis ZFHKF-1 TaxID=1196324 RepID=I8UG55_9BACL|nr:DUF5381 family protein [Fictibacillus macauensis]EIT85885.1 hypothetical protein A374_08619 [Fictibacillus macauensis ZFHKF-1]